MTSKRTWSLWDMLKRFETQPVLSALNYVSQTERKMRSDLEDMRANPGCTLNLEDAQQREILLGKFNDFRIAAEEYELQAVPSVVDEAERLLRAEADWTRIDINVAIAVHNKLLILHAVTTHSLHGSSLYHLSRGSADYVVSEKAHFGDAVEEAFPSAHYDIQEASMCRGLERWTACVMHCMRALEPAMIALATRVLGERPKKENWHDVFKEIKGKIDAEKNAGKHAAWQFESEAAAFFRDIKDGWRNHTMHAKVTFDEERAVGAYEATRSLMQHLARGGLCEPDSLADVMK